MTTTAAFVVNHANATWVFHDELASSSADTGTVSVDEWYVLQNLATVGVYVGFGVDATAANLESASTAGRFIDAGAEISIFVMDPRALTISALPVSGTSKVRILRMRRGA